ncbi:MAG TPA: S9 family peptidase [Candidatus Sulfotelmatobacter sp.]|nr:S9 family peptidase [Candidatus Sulfotelmatobacter sp.]
MRNALFLCAALSLCGLADCGGRERLALPPRTAIASSIIPVNELLQPEAATTWGYQVSPDGRELSWIAMVDNLPLVHVRRLDAPTTVVVATPFPVAGYRWAEDSRHILFQVDSAGSENTQIFVTDVERPQAAPVDMTPYPNTRNTLFAAPSAAPDSVLILSNRRDPSQFDLYRLGLDGAPPKLIDQNPGDVVTWYTDSRGAPYARLRGEASDHRVMEFRDETTGRWRPLLKLAFEDTLRLLDAPRDHSTVWALSNRGRDRVSLVQLDLATGKEAVVLSDPVADLEGAWTDDITGMPLLVWSWPDYQRLTFLDDGLAADFRRFTAGGPSAIRVLSTDHARQHIVVEVFSDERGTETYLLDRQNHQESLLSGSLLNRFRDRFPVTTPIAFKSRDGLLLHGYLTLPKGSSGRRLPLVLAVHGGPWARDFWPLDGFTLMLANRGYAVLRVNYRGSAGYGRAFREAAIGEFAGRMQDDLIDGVHWAVARGIADPKRVAIVGASYGGYAALVGMSFTPQIFAAGVDLFGISDLPSFYRGVPAYWKNEMPLWQKYVGDPDRPQDLRAMEAKSPLAHAAAIDRPLLVVQGANDVRVRRDQSDRLVAALRAAGKPVTYVVFPEEGHGIIKAQDLAYYYHELELFLARTLGGSVGPWGADG